MADLNNKIIETYGNRLRVRVCGICIEDNNILLVNHRGLNPEGDFWSLPGGGMDYGYSAIENLKREFQEETGIEIEVGKFLFVNEFLKPPLHAIELVFDVKRVSGGLLVGYDPELQSNEQIISDVKFISIDEVLAMEMNAVHCILKNPTLYKNFNALKKYYLSCE